MDTIQMPIRFPKDLRDKVAEAAKNDNRSMTKYVIQAVKEKIEKDARK